MKDVQKPPSRSLLNQKSLDLYIALLIALVGVVYFIKKGIGYRVVFLWAGSVLMMLRFLYNRLTTRNSKSETESGEKK